MSPLKLTKNDETLTNKHVHVPQNQSAALRLDNRHRCPKVCGGRLGPHRIRHDISGREGWRGAPAGTPPLATWWWCSVCRPPTPPKGAGQWGHTAGVGGLAQQPNGPQSGPLPLPPLSAPSHVTQCSRATWKCAIPNRTPCGSPHKLTELSDPKLKHSGTRLSGAPGRGRQVQAPPCSLSRRQLPCSPCRRIG